jgi:hypothetical protein
MTRQLPAAAVAVIAAALEDAARAGLRDPNAAATQAARALTDAGWTLTPSRTPGAPQTPTQHAA